MLDWESQGLDAQELGFPKQAIEIDAKGMCGEFRKEPRT